MKERIIAIWKDVANGVGNQGDFLRTFAEAMIRADDENYAILCESSIALIKKYKLGGLG